MSELIEFIPEKTDEVVTADREEKHLYGFRATDSFSALNKAETSLTELCGLPTFADVGMSIGGDEIDTGLLVGLQYQKGKLITGRIAQCVIGEWEPNKNKQIQFEEKRTILIVIEPICTSNNPLTVVKCMENRTSGQTQDYTYTDFTDVFIKPEYSSETVAGLAENNRLLRNFLGDNGFVRKKRNPHKLFVFYDEFIAETLNRESDLVPVVI